APDRAVVRVAALCRDARPLAEGGPGQRGRAAVHLHDAAIRSAHGAETRACMAALGADFGAIHASLPCVARRCDTGRRLAAERARAGVADRDCALRRRPVAEPGDRAWRTFLARPPDAGRGLAHANCRSTASGGTFSVARVPSQPAAATPIAPPATPNSHNH